MFNCGYAPDEIDKYVVRLFFTYRAMLCNSIAFGQSRAELVSYNIHIYTIYIYIHTYILDMCNIEIHVCTNVFQELLRIQEQSAGYLRASTT